MHHRLFATLLSLSVLTVGAFAAEKSEKKQASEAEIRARLHDHLLKKRATAAAAEKADKQEPATPAAPDSKAPPSAPPTATASTPAAPPAAPEPATVLPKVEVRKDRITELDRQLAQQNREIAREKQNTKPTALDETLNGPKTSRVFALFGGQSSEDRSNIAKERVAMMEDERDLIEAIAQAPTPEEKALLQKTLDSMRAMRRDLEQSLR